MFVRACSILVRSKAPLGFFWKNWAMLSCLFYTLVNSCLANLVCSSVSVGMNGFLLISSRAGF